MESILFRSFVSRRKKLRTSPRTRVVVEEVEGHGPTECPTLLFANQMMSVLEDCSASNKRPIIQLSLEQSVSNDERNIENLRNCEIQMKFRVDKPLEIPKSEPNSVVGSFLNPLLELTVKDCQSGTTLLKIDGQDHMTAKMINDTDIKESLLFLLDETSSFEIRTVGLSQFELKTPKSSKQLVFDGTVHTLWAILEQEIRTVQDLEKTHSKLSKNGHDYNYNDRVGVLRQRLTYWFSQENDSDRELLRLQQEKRRLGSFQLNPQEAEFISQKFVFKQSIFAAIVELFPSIKTRSVNNGQCESTVESYLNLIGSYAE